MRFHRIRSFAYRALLTESSDGRPITSSNGVTVPRIKPVIVAQSGRSGSNPRYPEVVPYYAEHSITGEYFLDGTLARFLPWDTELGISQSGYTSRDSKSRGALASMRVRPPPWALIPKGLAPTPTLPPATG